MLAASPVSWHSNVLPGWSEVNVKVALWASFWMRARSGPGGPGPEDGGDRAGDDRERVRPGGSQVEGPVERVLGADEQRVRAEDGVVQERVVARAPRELVVERALEVGGEHARAERERDRGEAGLGLDARILRALDDRGLRIKLGDRLRDREGREAVGEATDDAIRLVDR